MDSGLARGKFPSSHRSGGSVAFGGGCGAFDGKLGSYVCPRVVWGEIPTFSK